MIPDVHEYSVANADPYAGIQTVHVFTTGEERRGEAVWIEAVTYQGTHQTVWQGRLTPLFDPDVFDPVGTRELERRAVRLMAKNFLHTGQVHSYFDNPVMNGMRIRQ